MNYETLIVEKKQGIGKIILNRPEVLNALSLKLLSELEQAFRDMESDEQIHAVVLSGTGRAFSTGRDLKEVGEFVTPTGIPKVVASLTKPVIGAVNGYCYTGGLELALSCDLLIAAQNAIFCDTHARYGLLHGWGGTQRLPRAVGARKAKELLFTCEPVNATEAERIGLVNKVVPQDRLMEEAEELARKIAANSQSSVRKMKFLINQTMETSLATGLELEAQEYVKHRKELPAETKEQIQSFIKRKEVTS